MDSDDDEMRDASSSCSMEDGGGFEEAEEAAAAAQAEREGEIMTLEVTWFQVDLDYEFDAPNWFDLAREETATEAAAAEQWFGSAQDYPPSPLIAMMLADDLGLQGLRNTADADAAHCTTTSHDCPGGAEQKSRRVEGPGPCTVASKNERKPPIRNTVRCMSSRSSTLMKPTASQLAKQNRQVETKNMMLSKRPVGVRSDRTTMCSNDGTYQPAKRQRLESGHINKVAATHQPTFIHKNHEKNVAKCNIDRPSGLPKLKITVPREPELATKLRAERSRITRTMPATTKQINQWHTPSATTMQVHPTNKVVNPVGATDHKHTNRKHDDAVSNVPVCTSDRVRHLNHNVDKTAEDCRDGLFKFKARPVDRKILASKGDIGVSRITKRNTTVPKEFNLSKGRKVNPSPLSELFNQLSLTTGGQCGRSGQTTGRPNYITTKGCKENVIGNMQLGSDQLTLRK